MDDMSNFAMIIAGLLLRKDLELIERLKIGKLIGCSWITRRLYREVGR